MINKEEVKLSLFADDMILYIENPKSLLMKVKEENEKLNIQKTKIMDLVPSLHGKLMEKRWKH